MAGKASDVDTERALGDLVRAAHLAIPEDLPGLIDHAATQIGASESVILIVDHAQTVLVPLVTDPRAEPEPVGLEGTMAGRAFRQVEVAAVAVDGGERLWVPMVDGLERVGVLGLTFLAVDEEARGRATDLASLAATLLIAKASYGDTLVRLARREPMSLAAEMQWSLMPPLTAGTEQVMISAMLEPSYSVGGDLVDYALSADRADVLVLDAMGHGLGASTLAAVAVGAYRNARRARADLPAIAEAVETAVAIQFDRRSFVTALFAELDLESGRLRWIRAGHPPALLLRGGRVVKTLDEAGDPPLGMALPAVREVHEETLEPGDRLLGYSDGVVEARSPAGEMFGVERLADFVSRADASGEQLPETMRRLSRAVLEHQQGALQDDATQLLLEWRTDRARRLVP